MTRSVMLITVVFLIGCEPYRVEYRHRPGFYARASETRLPDKVMLDDGTVVIYTDRNNKGSVERNLEASTEQFQLREVNDDGTVLLRARFPEDVLAITYSCLQTEEYELLWDQIVSDVTKQEFGDPKQGKEEFVAHFKKHRRELARTLNRMLLGLPRDEVRIDKVDDKITTCTLRPQVAQARSYHDKGFAFTRVAVIKEGPGVKLLTIR